MTSRNRYLKGGWGVSPKRYSNPPYLHPREVSRRRAGLTSPDGGVYPPSLLRSMYYQGTIIPSVVTTFIVHNLINRRNPLTNIEQDGKTCRDY